MEIRPPCEEGAPEAGCGKGLFAWPRRLSQLPKAVEGCRAIQMELVELGRDLEVQRDFRGFNFWFLVTVEPVN